MQLEYVTWYKRYWPLLTEIEYHGGIDFGNLNRFGEGILSASEWLKTTSVTNPRQS